MGRSERALDPSAGLVQEFAFDLRMLRRAAGLPTYRELGHRAQYAPSVLSRAADGRELPSLNVTLAYVTACGGDRDAWEARWRTLAAERAPVLDADGPPSKGKWAGAGQCPPAGPRLAIKVAGTRARRLGRRGWLSWALAGLLAGAVAVVVEAGTGAFSAGSPAAHHPPYSAGVPSASKVVPLQDGSDPTAAGCAGDAITIASAKLRLRRPVVVRGKALGAGAVVGVVELRYSPHCDAAWGRVTPAALLPALVPGSVSVRVARLADGTSSVYRVSRLVQAWGDLLLMGRSCVRASGTLAIRQGPVTAASTACLSHP